jgi:hypothetical protein
MATKKPSQPDDLLAQLDDLSAKAHPRPKTTTSARTSKPTTSSQSEQDLLAELGSLAQRPASRPSTPSLKPNTTRAAPRSSTATPPPGRSSEEKSNSGGIRKSGDSTRSGTQAAFTPATTSTESPDEVESVPAPAKSGGWWGGILSTATAAVSQAQAAVKEIQKNEEAQRWAEQMRGNVGALRGLGMSTLF